MYKGKWIVFVNSAAGDAYAEKFLENAPMNYFDSHGYYSEGPSFQTAEEARAYAKAYNDRAAKEQLDAMPLRPRRA